MDKTSLRDNVKSTIGSFLFNVGFNFKLQESKEIIINGMIVMINQLSDYYEEGTHLFPEIILLDDLSYIATIPNFKYKFHTGKLELCQFKRALKMCSPLTIDGWSIYICVKDEEISWGVLTPELSETSLSLENQIVNDADNEFHVIYISNIGNKTVSMKSLGRKNECLISLSLHELKDIEVDNISDFCQQIIQGLDKDELFYNYINKTISNAIQRGHGNLFVVLEEKDGQCNIPPILKEGIEMTKEPIDFYDIYTTYNETHDETCKVNSNSELMMCANLAISMMNHDGITIFTDKGKLIGFHYIVDNNANPKEILVGGARTKAYSALVSSNQFKAVLMKSQEGEIKLEIKRVL